jgi:hypothetical protein
MLLTSFLIMWAIFSAGALFGMFITALFSANGRDNE